MSSVESRSEQLRKETYYVSSESKEGEISSYQGSDESYDENDQNYLQDHPLDSDDEIETRYLQDYGQPRQKIETLEQSKIYVTKRDLIQ